MYYKVITFAIYRSLIRRKSWVYYLVSSFLPLAVIAKQSFLACYIPLFNVFLIVDDSITESESLESNGLGLQEVRIKVQHI